MRRHDIHFVECLGAIRTFSHAIGDTVFHAVVAEQMAASLQDGILKVLSTDGAECESLYVLVRFGMRWGVNLLSTFPPHLTGC
jgi:hypothetical protein